MNSKKNEKTTEGSSNSEASTSENSDIYMSASTWKNWSPPKQLLGYSLKNFVTDPYKLNGLYSASGRYEKGEKWINISIVDGSTNTGKKEIRDHLEIANKNIDHSSEYGYEKTIEHNGIKAKEEYLAPPAGQFLIKFMINEHYGVSVKSNDESAQEIWSLIDKLELNKLTK